MAIDRFLGYWKPNAIVIMENELWPNLIMSAAQLRVIFFVPSRLLITSVKDNELNFQMFSFEHVDNPQVMM